jgi:hypothetical protein
MDMDGAIVYLLIAVLAAFTLSFLMVFHLPDGRWVDGIGLFFGGLGCVGLFYLFVLINEGPRDARPPRSVPAAVSLVFGEAEH